MTVELNNELEMRSLYPAASIVKLINPETVPFFRVFARGIRGRMDEGEYMRSERFGVLLGWIDFIISPAIHFDSGRR
uniref:Uncharacterized protein n=1 Tax=Salix viminalis TaxID=40686 RepID=A0A6N2NFC9_SALVM